MEHISKALARLQDSIPPSANGSRRSPTRSTLDERRSAQRSAALREYAELLGSTPGIERCPKCDGSGVVVDPLGFGHSCPECEPRRQAERMQVMSGLNADERAVRLDDVDFTGGGTDGLIVAARTFLVRPAGILTLWGGPGNAKTMVLQAIVGECLARSVPAVYTTFYDLAGYVREAFRDDSESAWRRMQRFQSVRVLCIDELDKVKDTSWLRELETAIIDKRYRDGLAGLTGTVIAMNESPDSLPEWIKSRLRDGRNRIVHNSDPDVRTAMSDESGPSARPAGL